MILQYLKTLCKERIILASSSPRRKEILQKLGLNMNVIPSTFDENLVPSEFGHPGEFAIATAKGKAEEVAKRISNEEAKPFMIISADTCISLSGKVYGKPKDREDAFSMLDMFSGNIHEVVTGVLLMVREGDKWQEISFHETTSVRFAKLSPEEINAYIDTGEPMDKAGGYGIQALGGTLVESIEGDYYNVMGFPLHRFCKKLEPILAKLQS